MARVGYVWTISVLSPTTTFPSFSTSAPEAGLEPEHKLLSVLAPYLFRPSRPEQPQGAGLLLAAVRALGRVVRGGPDQEGRRRGARVRRAEGAGDRRPGGRRAGHRLRKAGKADTSMSYFADASSLCFQAD